MDPHEKADGTQVRHMPIKQVLNPHVRRPPADDPWRSEYDTALRAVIHIAMIMSGVITVTVLTVIGVQWYIGVLAQGVIPGAIQEIGDFRLHL